MTTEGIKAELRTRFGSLSCFEIAQGLAKDSVRKSLKGRVSRRVSEAVAQALGRSPEELFPALVRARRRPDRQSMKVRDPAAEAATQRLASFLSNFRLMPAPQRQQALAAPVREHGEAALRP
ncbi:MAG: helix-turn-helix domain-containing protein [Caulobacteraceae bacterium]